MCSTISLTGKNWVEKYCMCSQVKKQFQSVLFCVTMVSLPRLGPLTTGQIPTSHFELKNPHKLLIWYLFCCPWKGEMN